ncbi:MAG: hypothetical protein PHP00_07910 [Thiotrichaceae bacterium]|nr:hypothetical protein [Thiotrichaceae bacterium]
MPKRLLPANLPNFIPMQILGLWVLALSLPSLGFVQRLFEVVMPIIFPRLPFPELMAIGGMAGYLLAVFGIVFYLHRKQALFYQTVQTKHALLGFILSLSGLLLLFMWLYPLATAGSFGGGSDRDEALNIAVTELLNGHYPYYAKTYVAGLPHQLGLDGNPISPLPGELLFALPFVAGFGNGAYQTFFWLGAWFMLLGDYLQDWRKALWVWLSCLIFAPVCLNEIISGGDLLANSLWVIIFSYGVLRSRSRLQIIFAILLGIGLASRPHFLLLLPLLFAGLWQQRGKHQAIRLSLWISFSFLAISLPFYLYDPQGFSPLHVYNKLARFNDLLPWASVLIPALTGLCALWLCYLPRNTDISSLFLRMAIVQSLPIVGAVALHSWQQGRVNFMEFGWYGLSAGLFAVLGLSKQITATFDCAPNPLKGLNIN